MSLVTDLREIERLHGQLLSTAMRGGNNGRLNAAAPIPGGPATDALGPWSFGLNDGSDKVAYSEALQEQYRNEHWNDWRRENHPLLTLATWSMCWRDWFGHTEELLRITVRSASTYLRLNADHMEHQPEKEHDDGTIEFPPDYGEMVRDIASVKAMLENIVCDGYREERSQVPCLDCSTVRLVKRYQSRVAKDHWLCPKCKRRYSDPEFALAKRDHLASDDAGRFVSLSNAAAAIGRSPNTVRRWTRSRTFDKAAGQWLTVPGKVRAACDPHTRLLLVYWPDIRDLNREQVMHAARRRDRVA